MADHSELVFDVGSYVVVKCEISGRARPVNVYYDGSMIQLVEDGWQIQCMRKVPKGKYSFPDVDDISTFKNVDIVKVLCCNKVVRTVYVFPGDFSEMNMR